MNYEGLNKTEDKKRQVQFKYKDGLIIISHQSWAAQNFLNSQRANFRRVRKMYK